MGSGSASAKSVVVTCGIGSGVHLPILCHHDLRHRLRSPSTNSLLSSPAARAKEETLYCRWSK